MPAVNFAYTAPAPRYFYAVPAAPAPLYRLALVRVDPRDANFDEVRYLDDPFATT